MQNSCLHKDLSHSLLFTAVTKQLCISISVETTANSTRLLYLLRHIKYNWVRSGQELPRKYCSNCYRKIKQNKCLAIFTANTTYTQLQWFSFRDFSPIPPTDSPKFWVRRRFWLSYLNYLYNRGRCLQTPPRQRSTDPKPVCHFDPQLMKIDVSYRVFGLVVN